MHATLVTLLCSFAGAVLLWHATEGGRAFTTEGARRLEIARNPRPVPSVWLETASGARVTSTQLLTRPTVVGFVYTHCGTACPLLVQQLRRLQDELRRRPSLSDVTLLSVSFDPARDSPERLSQYAAHFGGDSACWTFARIVGPGNGLRRWLETFEVVVVPDGLGGFEHNAALHVVDSSGRLGRIFDLQDLEGVLAHLGALEP